MLYCLKNAFILHKNCCHHGAVFLMQPGDIERTSSPSYFPFSLYQWPSFDSETCMHAIKSLPAVDQTEACAIFPISSTWEHWKALLAGVAKPQGYHERHFPGVLCCEIMLCVIQCLGMYFTCVRSVLELLAISDIPGCYSQQKRHLPTETAIYLGISHAEQRTQREGPAED